MKKIKKYENLISESNICSQATTNMGALDYVLDTSKTDLSKFVGLLAKEYYLHAAKNISDYGIIDIQEFVDVLYLSKNAKSKIYFLLYCEDQNTINYIDNIAKKLLNNHIGSCKNDKELYLYYLKNNSMRNSNKCCHMLFDTMSEKLKNDKEFIKEIITISDYYIKKNSYMEIMENYPQIESYPDILTEFNQELIRSKEIIEFGLKNDHMALYAESLYKYEIYKPIRKQYKQKINNNIENFAQRRLTTPEKIKIKMLKA